MSELGALLADSTLFHDLDTDTLEHIAEHCETRTFPPNTTIFSEGDHGETMYIIASGELTLYKQMGLGQRKIRAFKRGDHVGEMALISCEPRVGSIKTDTEVTCVALTIQGFEALMETDPRFAQRMLKTLSTRLRDTDEAATRDMIAAHQALSFSLAKLADSRDPETGGHLYRVRAYCQLLAGLLADHPAFQDKITESFIENIYLVAPLHDIGKVAIPDGVLKKDGRLTKAEMAVMSQHTTLGAAALDTVLEYCDFELFHMARRIILCHHEHFGGGGYPNGIKGEEIPIEARIMSLADNYDALLSKRVYKDAFTYEEAIDEIKRCSGTRFDPRMVDVMLENIDQFEAIHKTLADPVAEDH